MRGLFWLLNNLVTKPKPPVTMAQQPVTTAKPKPLTRQLSAVSTAHVSMRQHAMHFHEADLNEDGVLSRAEFHSSLTGGEFLGRSSLYYPIVIR